MVICIWLGTQKQAEYFKEKNVFLSVFVPVATIMLLTLSVVWDKSTLLNLVIKVAFFIVGIWGVIETLKIWEVI